MVKKKVRLHVYLKQNDKNTDRVWQTVGLCVFLATFFFSVRIMLCTTAQIYSVNQFDEI